MFDVNDLNFDLDGDGIPDVHATSVDFNGDGVPDMFLIDTDGDGSIDLIANDHNGDGFIDSYNVDADGNNMIETIYQDLNGDGITDIIYDSDGDGRADTQVYGSYEGEYGYEYDPGVYDPGIPNGGIEIDIDGDGLTDGVGYDTNGDGVLDTFEIDTDGDGYTDTIFADTDFDGEIDTASDLSGYSMDDASFDNGQAVDLDGDGIEDAIGFDSDGDGRLDQFYLDTDNDGEIDTILEDTDGDGINDFFVSQIDSDGDGVIDTIVRSYDYDRDGIVDSQETFTDLDGDGIFDVLTKAYDSDGDGEIDTFKTYVDQDGDGAADSFMEEHLIDTDGDGIADQYVVQIDVDGDGSFDYAEMYGLDPVTGELELLAVEGDFEAAYENTYGNFDPDSTNPDDVVGDPVRSMEEWEYQGNTQRCALYSQKFVIEELTGQDVDIEEIADLAEKNGWFSEEGGTTYLNMNKVLEHYGIENQMSFHNDIDDIRDCLDSGGKVIVALDSGEVWSGETNDLFDPYDNADHAVEVIGIDNSDPDHPMVILNDSGTPDGCGELVPLDTFLDAWEDSNCQMIACM